MDLSPDDTHQIPVLTCDQCGQQPSEPGHVADPWPRLWDAAIAAGWTGGAQPDAPHRCAACALERTATAWLQSPPANNLTGSSELRADLRTEPAAAIVTLDGDLNAAAAADLRCALSAATNERADVILDMQAVHLIDSVGLGTLVWCRQELRNRQGRLCLAAPSRFIRTVLHTMHLDPVFPIFDHIPAALRWLAAPAQGS